MAQPEIPRLGKRSKDEKKEEKGGAALIGRGAGGPGLLYRWLGLGGHSAAASLAQFLTSNIGLSLLTAALSVATLYGLYTLSFSSGENPAVLSALFPAREAQTESSPSAAAPRPKAEPSSLSYFARANRGAIAEGAPAQAKAEASPIDAGPQGPAEVKPAAADQTAKADQDVKPSDTGKLAGMLKNNPKMRAAAFGGSGGLGSGNGLAGGAGMAGGIGRAFSGKTPNKLQAFSKALLDKGTPGHSPSAGRPHQSLDQLRLTNRLSQQARNAGASEAQSAKAMNAFEGGLGRTSGQLQSAMKEQASDTPHASTIGGSGDGGPLGNGTVAGEQAPPPTGSSSDKSPWTGALMMGAALLMSASSIILIEGVVAQIAKIFIPLEPVAQMMAATAAAMAATAAGIGAMIMTQHGQPQQGMILTIGGGITSAAAISALAAPPETAPINLVLGGIAGTVSAILAMITGAHGHKVH